ncbi:unnamed protein product [Heterobilharzia americana]|nr:unnamed protein product [Heterobilharzia americana]
MMIRLPSSIPIIDVRVLDADDQENIWKILKYVFPSWSEKYTKVQALEEGLSNTVLRFDYDNKEDAPKSILMRIRKKLVDSILNRWDEIKHMCILHQLGNEQELYAVFQNGLVYSFLQGSTIHVDRFSVPEYSELIIDRLARLHSLPTKEALLLGFSDSQKFTRLKNEFPSQTCLLNEVSYLEKLLSNVISPVVLCHNDLLAGNIVLSPNEKSVHFIDFEYCGFNHAAFDIGNHFCEFAGINVVNFDKYPTKEYQRMWINSYLTAKDYYTKKFNKQDHQSVNQMNQNGYCLPSFFSSNHVDQDDQCVNKSLVDKWLVEVNNFAMAAHLFWGVWAVILSNQEQNKFDYLSFSTDRCMVTVSTFATKRTPTSFWSSPLVAYGNMMCLCSP